MYLSNIEYKRLVCVTLRHFFLYITSFTSSCCSRQYSGKIPRYCTQKFPQLYSQRKKILKPSLIILLTNVFLLFIYCNYPQNFACYLLLLTNCLLCNMKYSDLRQLPTVVTIQIQLLIITILPSILWV